MAARNRAIPRPTPPSSTPEPKDQYNFTDAESRSMKTGGGFEQCYNAQAAAEVESRLIVGERVSQTPNDKQELVPSVAAIASEAGSVAAVLNRQCANRNFAAPRGI